MVAGSGRRALMGAALGIGLLAACGAFDAEDRDRPDPALDGGGSSGTSSGSTSGQSSSSSGETSSSSSSSSGSACPCLGGVFCDPFERQDPAGNGWTYYGRQAQTSDAFHISHDSGAPGPCDGAFYALATPVEGDGGASRVMSRLVDAKNQSITIDVLFSPSGDVGAITGKARAAFIALTPQAEFDLNQPFIAFGMKDKKLVLFGQANSTDGPRVLPTTPTAVHLVISTKGGVSSMEIGGVNYPGAFAPLSAGTTFTLFIGDAVALSPPSPGVGARFDNLSLSY